MRRCNIATLLRKLRGVFTESSLKNVESLTLSDDVRIPDKGEAEQWRVAIQEKVLRTLAEERAKRKSLFLPRVKQEIADEFRRKGECDMDIRGWQYDMRECVLENFKELKEWAANQGVTLELGEFYHDSRGRVRKITGKWVY